MDYQFRVDIQNHIDHIEQREKEMAIRRIQKERKNFARGEHIFRIDPDAGEILIKTIDGRIAYIQGVDQRGLPMHLTNPAEYAQFFRSIKYSWWSSDYMRGVAICRLSELKSGLSG